MTLTDKPVTNFLDELASNAPAPGGGVAAPAPPLPGRVRVGERLRMSDPANPKIKS